MSFSILIFFFNKKKKKRENKSKFIKILTLIFFPHQIITTIPTSVLPKRICSWGGKKQQEMEEDQEEEAEEVDGVPGRRGQILWIRGLARLQTQVRACPGCCHVRQLLFTYIHIYIYILHCCATDYLET